MKFEDASGNNTNAMDFRSLIVQLRYWNGHLRRPAGFSFSGSTTLVLERASPAAGWIFRSDLVVQL